MRFLGVLLMIPLVAACATMNPGTAPSASVTAEPSGVDVAGRWRGTWTGAGMFHSMREDSVTVDLVQQGNRGMGRLVIEGAIAAESVPVTARFQGLNGIRIVADISSDTVRLRHQLDSRLFAADMKLYNDGERMFGYVRGGDSPVGLLLVREGRKLEDPQQSAKAVPQPVETAAKTEPEPQMIAMVPDSQREETARPAERPRQEEFISVQELTAIHFDYDKALIRPDSADTLIGHAEWLKAHSDTAILIEGHCDERGTAEYNVALGDRRAKSVKDYLAAHGVAPERVTTVSHGKERPACAANTEACHGENRRAEFRIKTQ
jgi:peptidoglycan-associated lipoprotein